MRPVHFLVCLLLLGCYNSLFAQFEIYLINTDTGIERATLDGTNRQVLVPDSIVKPQGIAVDEVNGKIYWTDWVSDKIQRANLDGTEVEDILTEGLMLPEGIALDVEGNKMYWVDSGTKKIYRANMDGTEVEDLVIYQNINLDGIVLDIDNEQFYWSEWGDGAAVGKVKAG